MSKMMKSGDKAHDADMAQGRRTGDAMVKKHMTTTKSQAGKPVQFGSGAMTRPATPKGAAKRYEGR